ncbi:MAG TPA: ABC transporter permease [Polyangiaceae bacterium]|nr:ABC transporter permease [Polyangiaceae bacterium]
MSAFGESLWLALRSVLRSGLRSTLTVLGILIGIAAVVTVVALGESAREQVTAQIQSLGSNLIYVFNGEGEGQSRRGERAGHRLTVQDAEAIRREVPGLRGITVYSSTTTQVVSDFETASVDVVGADQDYATVRGYAIESGRDLSRSEVEAKAKVCLIGASAAEKLFGKNDPVGYSVRIGRHRFEIIGLLSRKGQSPFGSDQDNRLVMPIGGWHARVLPGHERRVDIIIASAPDSASVAGLRDQMDQVMLEQHRIGSTGKRDFRLLTQDSFRKSEEEIYQVLSLVLISVAAISLFVGGVGVMNIMLVNVTERRREIGTRLAVGARQQDIRWQFLAEAITLTCLGGVAGLGLAIGGLRLLERQLGWTLSLPLTAVAAALGTSVALGIAFGFWPAQRAARLDPIEALRYE